MYQPFLVQNNWNSLNFIKLIIMKKYLYFLLFTPFIFYGQIQINEIFADNGNCCLDEASETEDYLELINTGPSPIDLAGYYFGDQDGGSVIPSGSPELTTISSGGLLLLWFDQDLEQGPLHVDAKLNNDGFVSEVAEKKPISNIATVGVYYWKRGSEYVKYAEQMIDKDIRTNNEFYVCPVFNEAIGDDKKVKVFPIEKMWGLGTPEDLERYLNDFNIS